MVAGAGAGAGMRAGVEVSRQRSTLRRSSFCGRVSCLRRCRETRSRRWRRRPGLCACGRAASSSRRATRPTTSSLCAGGGWRAGGRAAAARRAAWLRGRRRRRRRGGRHGRRRRRRWRRVRRPMWCSPRASASARVRSSRSRAGACARRRLGRREATSSYWRCPRRHCAGWAWVAPRCRRSRHARSTGTCCAR